MKTFNIDIEVKHYLLEELTAEDQELVNKAIGATANAYANYSHFYVGAALRLQNGEIVIGANQENAAFPSSLCAERSAIFAAQSQSPDQPVKAIAIAAKNVHGLLEIPITPCGACRQVMLEIEDRYKQPVRVLLYGKVGVYELKSVKDLLPLSFVDSNMR